jgi:serine/threonine-protein kinase
MRKLVARHRFGAAAVIGIAVTLAAGLVVSWIAWRSTAAALEDVRDERARATAAAEKTTAVNAFLARMLSSADPDAGDVRDLTMREKLDQAVRILDSGALAGQPDVEATVRLTIGEAYLAIGQTGAADPLLGGVLDAYLDQHGESAHPDVAGALEAMARLRRAQGRYDESDALFVRAIAMWRSVHPGDHADVARALMLHATLLHNASRRDEAITQARAALAMRERLHGFEHVEVARAKISLAYFVRDRSESLALVREALAAERAALGPNAPEVARALQSLGRLQHRAGEHAGAEASYLEAIDVARRAFGADHPLVVAVVLDLSFLYRSLGEIERGVGVAAEYDPAARAAFGEESLRYAKYVKWLGDVREEGGDAPAAESEFRRALAIFARIGEERSLDAVRARVALAGTLIRQEAWDEAEAILRATMAEDESVLPASYWARPQAEALLGEVLGARGDFAQAESTLTAAFDRFMAIHVPRELRVSSAARLAAMYERWDAAAPGTGKAELAAHWRHQQRALASP